MWMAKEFEAESFEGLQHKYAESYIDSFVNEKHVKPITYKHDTGMYIDLNDAQIVDFCESVNELIEQIKAAETEQADYQNECGSLIYDRI